MSRPAAVVLALLLVLAGGPAASGQGAQPSAPPAGGQPSQDPPQQDGEQQPPVFRTGINFVRVDVIVTDRQGNPVLNLEPDEFLIYEDGKPQTIETFSVVQIDEASQVDAPLPSDIRSVYEEEREAARSDVRLFVILLDDYHVRRGNDMAVRKPLVDFVQNQLAPADMVAIMYPLTSVSDLRFTRNRRAIVSEIERFQGRKFDYTPRNQFEEQYAYYPAATVERVRNEVTMGALKGAAVRLGNLREGRKSIIFVSEGFTSSLPPQLNDPIAAMPGIRNPARGRPGANVPINESAEFFSQTDLMNQMREVFDIANRQNTSIYAVDPRGLATFAYDIGDGVAGDRDRRALSSTIDTLRVLADNTDGRAIVNQNDISRGMQQIIRDSSGYYLIGYTSSQAPTDGKFHEIRVQVKRRGLDVRARKGYYAYTAAEAAAALAPPKPEPPAAVTAALNAIAEPARGRPARFWVGTAMADGGQGRVTFVWEPIPPTPGVRRGEDERVARVMLTANSADGRPLFRGPVPDGESEEPTGPAGPGGPPGAGVSFDAPPGQVQLRMVVEGAGGQVLDSAVNELTVPDFAASTVVFGTPRVYRGRTVRDIQNAKADPDSVPVADRDFSRTDRILVRVEAYTNGGDLPDVTARLLSRTGQAMSDLPTRGGDGAPVDVEFPLSMLAAGDYLIEFTAKAASGTAQELVAFKVGR